MLRSDLRVVPQNKDSTNSLDASKGVISDSIPSNSIATHRITYVAGHPMSRLSHLESTRTARKEIEDLGSFGTQMQMANEAVWSQGR